MNEPISSKSSSNIQVLVRIRPMNEAELNSTGSLGRTNVMSVIPGENIISVANDAIVEDVGIASGGKWRRNTERMRDISVSAREIQRKKMLEQSMDASFTVDHSFSLSSNSSSNRMFEFDYVLPSTSSQADTYDHVKDIVETCLQGYNGTIIAYGQTGSGKTHTVFGDGKARSDPGLVQRSLKDLFNGIRLSEADAANTSNTEFIRTTTKATFYEIFNEKVHDLLSDNSLENALSVREDAKNGVYVDGLTEIQCKSTREAEEALMKGMGNRHVAATAMNRSSSRSHAVFALNIRTEQKTHSGVMKVRRSKFTLVDLAGSERQKLTDTAGERLKEASMINKSLTSLGHVINALSDIEKGRDRHVHYRDSKLTFLLSDSLGGNSRTCLVATVSPSARSLGETLSTLKFAQRAKLIKNSARVNEDTNTTIAALQAEIEKLRASKSSSLQNDVTVSSTSFQRLARNKGNKLTKAVNDQEIVIKNLKRKLQEQTLVQNLKQARIDILYRKTSGKSVKPDCEVKLLCDEIDALHRQLSLPSSDAIEWKSAYARDIDSEVHEPPPIMSASENCVQLAVLGDKIKVLELEKTKLTETIKILKSTSSVNMREALDALDDLDEKVKTLSLDLKGQKAKTQAALLDAKSEQEKIASVLSELSNVRSKLRCEKDSGTELAVEIERLMDKVDALTDELNSVRKEKEEVTLELEHAKQVQSNASADILTTESQLRQDIATMSKDNAILLGKVKELTKEDGKRRKEYERLQKKMDTMKNTNEAEISLLQADNHTLKKQVDNLSQEKSDIINQTKEEQKSKVSHIKHENSTLLDRIHELEVKLLKQDPVLVNLEAKLNVALKEREDLEFERDALQEDQDTLTENIRFLTQQNSELEDEISHFCKVIGIEESFGSQGTNSNQSRNIAANEKSFSSPNQNIAPFEADQSPIPSTILTEDNVSTPLKLISSSTKQIRGGVSSIKKSTTKKTRTPFSNSKSRLNIPYIVQNALEKNTMGNTDPTPEDEFDDSMFLPNIDKENVGTPFKPAKQSGEPSSITSKGDPNRSQIFRSNWSYTM